MILIIPNMIMVIPSFEWLLQYIIICYVDACLSVVVIVNSISVVVKMSVIDDISNE